MTKANAILGITQNRAKKARKTLPAFMPDTFRHKADTTQERFEKLRLLAATCLGLEKPTKRLAAKKPTLKQPLTAKQIAAGQQLYKDFCKAGSTVTLANFAVKMAKHGVWSKDEAADILGITTTRLNDAAKARGGKNATSQVGTNKQIPETGATTNRREELRRTAANRLGIAFKASAFAAQRKLEKAAIAELRNGSGPRVLTY
ncbi:MAG: hypothetical protein V4621_01580 [Pseudomonadota bacterium]